MHFTWLTPPGPYWDTTCWERNWLRITYILFWTTQGHGGPPRMSDQLNAGAISETTRTLKTIHTIHSHIHPIKTDMRGWLWWPNDIRGLCRSKSSLHLSYRWGKPRENLTQETCPDRRSNPGSLRDRCACYRLLHSGGQFVMYYNKKLRYIKKLKCSGNCTN